MNKLAFAVVGTLAVAVVACSQKSEPQQPAASAEQAQTAAPAQAAPAAQAPAGNMPMQGQMPMDAAHQQAMASAHPAGVAMQAAPAGAQPMGANGGQGKVVQTMHASSYTYMEVDTGGKKVWIAANAMQVNNGDTVRWNDAAVMKNFTSNTLHRTFDEILFVSAVQLVK